MIQKEVIRVTRGHGLLEGFLARKRTRMANKLIPPGLRSGRILDVGCGSHPFFLLNTQFAEKYGLDQVFVEPRGPRLRIAPVTLLNHDVETAERLPFPDEHFEVVTMLAVIEHLADEPLERLLRETYRVLKPGGVYILTTPARWSDGILRAMSRLGLISREELDEHQQAFDHPRLRQMLQAAGFPPAALGLGYFEFFLNLWAKAKK